MASPTSSVRPASLPTLVTSRRSHVERMRWIIARTHAMGLREWVGRIAHLTRASIDVAFDGNRRLHARRWPIVASLPDDAIPASVLSRERADLVRELLPDDAEAIVAVSKRVLAGEFSLLGYEPTTLQRPLRYDFDPF